MAENQEPSPSAGYALRNRAAWDALSRHYYLPGRRAWQGDVKWGIWEVPEEELRILPGVSGIDAIELGCGTAYLSSWLAKRGARVVGIDNSREQLGSAMTFQREFHLDFPLVFAHAEELPFPDRSFDLAVSEYGASIWCDPYRWIPEAARVLRPGGELIFMVGGAILWLCEPDTLEDAPAGRELVRDYFGVRVFASAEDGSVEFHLGHGDWIRLLRANGFDVLNLVEVRPPENSITRFPYVTLDWARRWPSEEIWIARKTSGDQG